MSEVLPLPEGHGLIRRARRDDLPEIVRLLADDPLGRTREALTQPLPERYYQAFEAIEADPSLRNQGLGRVVMQWATEQARQRGCTLVQLTTHKSRRDAHRFYQRLGFISSHEGMKLKL